MLSALLLTFAFGTAEPLAQEPSAAAEVPKGAVVLFDGKSTEEWVHRRTREAVKWKVENGELIVSDGPDIVTKREIRRLQASPRILAPAHGRREGPGPGQ